MTVLIIDNYDSFTYNLYQLIAMIAADEKVLVKRNDEISLLQIKGLGPKQIVLSPGPGHPASDRDFGVCKDVIESSADLGCPVLGVCLGHQGIVQHSGGEVVRAPEAVHGKMSPLKIVADSPLFAGIDSGVTVMRYHSLIAQRSTLPAQLEIVAEVAGREDIIMSVQDRQRRLYGLQFHPESVGTATGRKILENFMSLC